MQHATIAPRRDHLTRLMLIWRSAGWRCHDGLELDLIAAGWAALSEADGGHDRIVLTDAGVRVLADARQRNLRSSSAHDRLSRRMAEQLLNAGRIVWRELSLRARVAIEAAAEAEHFTHGLWPQNSPDSAPSQPRRQGCWRMARPDVFSVRQTSVEDYLQPMIHEIKVSRADLLSDLRHAAKCESYRWLSCETYYVIPEGLATPEEIPPEFGIWVIHGPIDSGTLELVRPATHVPRKLPFTVWIALARATPVRMEVEPAQRELGEVTVDHVCDTSGSDSAAPTDPSACP